jgi:omega-6 fatty acid desaturase (delta-12 desaturase)
MATPRHALASVLEVFPASCYANPTWKGVAFLARDAALYLAAVAALGLVDSLWLLLPLWVFAGLAISALFILGHDTAHGSLFRSDRLNRLLGQLAMLPALHVFEAWIFGHNRVHHGHTVRETMDYVWHPLSPAEYAALSKPRRALHRLEWSLLGAGIYYLIEIWWKKMIRFDPPEKHREAVHGDRRVVLLYAAGASAAALGAGAAFYGSAAGAIWMWFKVLAVPFLIWNYSIGITVYVHHISEDIAWAERRAWTKWHGQMEGTTIIHLPAWLNVFYHNIFLHVPHHVDMRIPFYNLPQAAAALREHYSEVIRERGYSLGEYLRTTRACKLFDFERGVWCDYRGVSAEARAA